MSETVRTDVEVIEKENSEASPSYGTNPMNYKVIVDMVKEMEEQYNTLKTFTENRITSTFQLKTEIMDALFGETKETIAAMGGDEIVPLYSKYSLKDLEGVAQTSIEEMRETLIDVKELCITLMTMKVEMDSLKEESQDVLTQYFNFMSSTKVKEARAERLKTMKEEVEKEQDERLRKDMKKMIAAMEATQTMAFMFSRFEEFGEQEIEAIKTAFFDEKKGSYVINRFKAKIEKFGFNSSLYKYFFNLEENFLEEEYRVYNNLFLFVYMRFIAYADPYNKEDNMYGRAVTSGIADLVYHKFSNLEDESNFVEIIRKVLNNFTQYHDYFEQYNSTQPTHPKRLEAEKFHEENRRRALIAKMDEMKIEGYDPTASANQLQEYFNTKLDELTKAQVKASEESNAKVTESEDGTVTIEPNFEPTDSESDASEAEESATEE